MHAPARPRPRQVARSAAFVAAALLLTTACTSTSTADPSAHGSAGAAPAAGASPSATVAGGTGSEPGTTETGILSGPITQLLAATFEDYDGPAALERRSADAELKIVACMAQEGWDYLPADGGAGSRTELEIRGGLDEDAFAEQFGYGFANSPMGPPPAEGEDPNAAYVASLSTSEAAAYERSLFGDPEMWQEQDASTDPPPVDMAKAGCSARSYMDTTTSAVNSVLSTPEADEVDKIFQAAHVTAESDPRVVAARETWAACMATAGHAGFSEPLDAYMSAAEEFEALITGDAPDKATLAEFGRREVALATADRACHVESDYDAVLAQAGVDAETAAYDANRELFETFAALAEDTLIGTR